MLSEELSKLISVLEAMSFILDSISKNLSDSDSYDKPMPGTDTLQSVLEWQVVFNKQIKAVRDAIDRKFEEEQYVINDTPVVNITDED